MVGQLSVARKARLDVLLEHHTDLLAAIETWERHSDLVVIPDDADLDHFGLSGFASDALTELHTDGRAGRPGPCCPGCSCTAIPPRGVTSMRLNRVQLRNYRGVAKSDVTFSQNGVTIVEGPNEVGKTCHLRRTAAGHRLA